MAQKISITKYKKIIMLSLIAVAAIICIVATYVTEYNNNKVTIDDVFTTEMNKTFKSSEEFTANFTEFKIVLDKIVEPYDETLGKHTFIVETTAAETSKIKGEISVTIALGANWVKYISETGNSSIEIGKENEKVSINGIDVTFPLKGDLLFLPKLEPTVYVMVEWGEKDNSEYYTYLEFDYSECK